MSKFILAKQLGRAIELTPLFLPLNRPVPLRIGRFFVFGD